MNDLKLNYIKSNIKFHLEDLSIDRQLEIKSRPEPNEWKYLALGEDNLENIERYGTRLWDNPQFRSRIDRKLAALNREDDKQFAKAYASEYRKKGIWVAEETARHKYERMRKYWSSFGGDNPIEFTDENGKTCTFTFNYGVTELGKQLLYNLMASTTSFEQLTQDDWFVLWTASFTHIAHIN